MRSLPSLRRPSRPEGQQTYPRRCSAAQCHCTRPKPGSCRSQADCRSATAAGLAASAVAAAGASPAAAAAAAWDSAAVRAVADISEGSPDLLQLASVLGIVFGGAAVALWSLERQTSAQNAAAAEAAAAKVKARDDVIARLEAELEAERKARKDAEGLKGRLEEATRDVMKLEKALEIKDGQLDVFITTARRQIRALEDDVRELQRMPR